MLFVIAAVRDLSVVPISNLAFLKTKNMYFKAELLMQRPFFSCHLFYGKVSHNFLLLWEQQENIGGGWSSYVLQNGKTGQARLHWCGDIPNPFWTENQYMVTDQHRSPACGWEVPKSFKKQTKNTPASDIPWNFLFKEHEISTKRIWERITQYFFP